MLSLLGSTLLLLLLGMAMPMQNKTWFSVVTDCHIKAYKFPTLQAIKQTKAYGLKLGKLPPVIKVVSNSLLLLLGGDIELNPGPTCVYKKTTELFNNSNKKLKFFHINCQSIAAKRTQIENIIQDLGNNTVYGFSETWLKEEDSEKLWEIEKKSFKTFRSDRNSTLKEKGGGVMLSIPKTLNPKLRKDLNHLDQQFFESLWIECSLNNDTGSKCKQLINISYNPKKSLTNSFLEELSTSIDHAITENKPITLMGDYNIDYLNWKERQFLDSIIVPYGLNVINSQHATRIQGNSKSLIDYIISDLPNAKQFQPIVSDTPLRTSKNNDIDHQATSTITQIQMKTKSKVIKKEFFDKTKYSKDGFRNLINESNWAKFYNQDCAEGMFTVFIDIIEKALKKCTSKKTVFIRNDKNCLTLHSTWVNEKTKNIYRRIKPNMNPNDATYKELKHDFLNNLCSDKIEHQIKNFNNLKTEKDKWNFINEARNAKRTTTSIPSLKNCFGDLITDELQIANLLNYRFSKLGDYIGNYQTYVPRRNTEKTFNEFKFQPISIYECKKYLKKLNTNKPLGPSEIPAWALKDAANVIIEHLTFLINAFLTEGKFPNHLKQAYVVPIFKKGDYEEPNNYRPISITSALSKIFENILRDQIVSHLNRNNILSASQFGFRSSYSSSDALLIATENIRSRINENKNVAAAFIDLSKAFDSISHSILLEKLRELNFDNKAVSLIESYLKNRNQKVVLNTCKSDWIQLYQGVPQGTILGPLLFNIYVNDMRASITKDCNLVQYADDTMIYSDHVDEVHATKALENNVKNLINFFESHYLTINTDKTEFIIFSKPSNNSRMRNRQLNIRSEVIKTSDCIKYLGVYLDQNLTFQCEVKNLLQKMAAGIKTLYAIRDLFPEKTRLLLLNALVISHLHYSAILLNGISENLLTTLEKQISWAVKACFNRKKNDHSTDLKLKHDILPIRYFLNMKSALYFWKFTHKMIPALAKENQPPTAMIRKQERTNQLYIDVTPKTAFLKLSFFNSVVQIWNTLPEELKTNQFTYNTTKRKFKNIFLEKFKTEVNIPEITKKCWKDFRFL